MTSITVPPAAAAGLLLALLLPAPRVAAQAGPGVGGTGTVLLGRVYLRVEGATLPVSRFGLRLDGGRAEHVVTLPESVAPRLGGSVVAIGARRRGSGAVVDWSLARPGRPATPDGHGAREIERGTLGHLVLRVEGSEEVFASLEVGRASDFEYSQLESHFGGQASGGTAPPTGRAAPPHERAAPVPAPMPMARAPAPQWEQPMDAPATRSPTVRVVAPVAPVARLALILRVEQDGRVVFEPRVRVASGEAFHVEGGQPLAMEGGRYAGLAIDATPRLEGNAVHLDLSVQSGRALDRPGPAAFLIDRYRRDVVLPIGRDVTVELFDDLRGGGGSSGRLRLVVTATVE